MKHGFLWMLAGFLSLAAGLVALLNPFAATLAAEVLIGALFGATGILTIATALNEAAAGRRLLGFGLGILMIALGASLVIDPLRGMLELTVFAALLLVVLSNGISLIALALDRRGRADA